ncbi:proline-rich protein [Russula earlei]|uniref:Proline-rich protein n=1 Tax=Russula earlei TaxID=71964 RepID=A0ACC0TVP3_9AGAM|nr:proline-rich protein [Russula earlei]
MLQFYTLLLSLSVAGSVIAAPTHLNKRIAQVISDSTTKWEAACDRDGGGQQCNPIAVNAFGTLLAAAGPCDQQDHADIMMDLSKKLNSPDMIKFAQIFAQQPRNTPDSVSVQYCQKAPRNQELSGLFQCQFQGADPTRFTGGLKVGDQGTIPFGQASILNPAGSCPAHPSGPIADGTQLVDQVSSPGVPSIANPGNGKDQNPPPTSSSLTLSVPAPSAVPSPPPPAASPPAPSQSPSPSTGSKGFAFQNGQDAQALNQKFQTLTVDSPCNDGEEACVNGDFAQCEGGKFVTTPCSSSSSLKCVALPLVNSRGTSITCDTQSDADARIAEALASGGQ